LDRAEHLFRVPADIVVWRANRALTCAEKGCNEAAVLTRARLGEDAWSASAPPRVMVTGMGQSVFAAVCAALAPRWPTTMLGRDEPDTFRAQLVKRLGGQYLPLDAGELRPTEIESPAMICSSNDGQ